MELVDILGLINVNMKESMKVTQSMALVFTHGQTDRLTKATGRMVSRMDWAHMYILMIRKKNKLSMGCGKTALGKCFMTWLHIKTLIHNLSKLKRTLSLQTKTIHLVHQLSSLKSWQQLSSRVIN